MLCIFIIQSPRQSLTSRNNGEDSFGQRLMDTSGFLLLPHCFFAPINSSRSFVRISSFVLKYIMNKSFLGRLKLIKWTVRQITSMRQQLDHRFQILFGVLANTEKVIFIVPPAATVAEPVPTNEPKTTPAVQRHHNIVLYLRRRLNPRDYRSRLFFLCNCLTLAVDGACCLPFFGLRSSLFAGHLIITNDRLKQLDAGIYTQKETVGRFPLISLAQANLDLFPCLSACSLTAISNTASSK
jgi:hypothetical protein